MNDSRQSFQVARLLLTPLQIAPLLMLAIMSVLMSVCLRLGPFGIPMALIVLSWFLKYSFVLLDQLVGGITEAPALSIEMVKSSLGEWRALLPLVLVLLLFFASGAASWWVGPVVTSLVAALVVFVLPAVLAVQGWTGSVGQSLSPRTCRQMVRILRSDYWWIVGCALTLVALCVLAFALVDEWVPLAIRAALVMYTWLAIFSLVGGALHAHRPDLERETGFLVKVEREMTPEEIEAEREQRLDSIYGSWRSGARQNAWQSVTRLIERSAEPLDELRWLYRRAAKWDSPEFANQLAQELIPRLRVAGCEGEAQYVSRERLAADPGFRLPPGASRQ